MAMRDSSISQEEAANERRATAGERDKQEPGLIGTVERAFPFVRDQVDEPETVEEAEQLRRANDADQRD
jgi:hypothetical protein